MISFTLPLLCVSLFILVVRATSEEELCQAIPWGTNSPFTPWFTAWPNVTSGPGDNVQNLVCWWYADCNFASVPDTRKQQYAACALVMGLIPLMLKDVAWPQRRIAFISKKKSPPIEIIIRALGLDPTVVNQRNIYKPSVFDGPVRSRLCLVGLIILFIASLGPLTIMEIYSKRSSLGCPVPVFIVIWQLLAIAPAALEVGVGRYMQRKSKTLKREIDIEVIEYTIEIMDKSGSRSTSRHRGHPTNRDSSRREQQSQDKSRPSNAIPGRESHWTVQIGWAVYYAGGTLIWSSIMLVTAVELLVWFLSACFFTAASKLLAYKLCGHLGDPSRGSQRSMKQEV